MRHTLPALLMLALLSAIPMGAQTQECRPDEQLGQCWADLGNTFPGTKGADAAVVSEGRADAAQKTESTANSGVPSLVSPGGSSLTDFLSLLTASLQSSSLKTEGQTITFDANPPIAVLGADHALKLEAVFAKPKLNGKVTDALASNAGTLKKFDDSLSNTDDAIFSFAIQPASMQFGRSITPYRPMFTSLEGALYRQSADDASDDAFVDAIFASGKTATNLVRDLTESQKAAFENTARQSASLLTTFTTFDRAFAKLLNNQPQFFFTGSYEARRNIVGPNEWTGKLTYEMAGRNLNGFRKGPGADCVSDSAINDTVRALACASSLIDYAKEPTVSDDRLAVSAEYHRANRRWIADMDSGLAFGYPRIRTLSYTVKYGRTMMGAPLATTNGRIDLSVQYDDVSNGGDPTQNVKSRATGTLTYTQKISETMSFPISLVYANHASDLPSVDRRLNVHFGIVWKMPATK